MQVFPLLMQHFTYKEQAGLVWQFICSIPVNLLEKFLPWLAFSLSDDERQQMVTLMCEVVPPEELLQQVGYGSHFLRATIVRHSMHTLNDNLTRVFRDTRGVGIFWYVADLLDLLLDLHSDRSLV